MTKRTVTIGDRIVGDDQPCMVVAEIGINHNGQVGIAKGLIVQAARAGVEAVKFQKRTLDVVYTKEELAKPRQSPFGTTNGDLKRGLEFGTKQYAQIDLHCAEQGMIWFASCWDEQAVDFIERYNPPCYKIASASITDHDLINHTCRTGKPIILSTGMSHMGEIDLAVHLIQSAGNPLIILHCTSTYPAKPEELNLSLIPRLRERYGVPVGYSGHEVGLMTSVAAVGWGACMVERHITLDRSMFGSDQAASVEPQGFEKLVKYIRTNELAAGDGIKRVYPGEIPIRDKLRRVAIT